MLHVHHHVFQNSVRDIADEQIMLRVSIRDEGQGKLPVLSWSEGEICGFSAHTLIFVVLGPLIQGSWQLLPNDFYLHKNVNCLNKLNHIVIHYLTHI